MLIDWFTVGAQTLNFLILVWLLRHFLYKPVLNAIDAREKKVAAELAGADAKKAEAEKERSEFRQKNQEFDQQRAALLTKATDEAKAEGKRMLDDTRNAADKLAAKRQETLRNDMHNLIHTIARRAQQEVFVVARKALSDLASTDLEERMGAIFTRRLSEIDSQAKTSLRKALTSGATPALVRSAFDLPVNERSTIQNAINETFSADIHLRFETSPDLVCGIEIAADGQKVAWSIADYLSSLEQSVAELVIDQRVQDTKSVPEAEKPKAEPRN